MAISNTVCLQWGHLQIFSDTVGIVIQLTLPTAYKKYGTVVVNAGVGTSGWIYMNGIYGYLSSSTEITLYHSLGKPNSAGEICNWISIGY